MGCGYRVGVGVSALFVLGVACAPIAAADSTEVSATVVPGALTMTGGGGDVDLGPAELDEVNTLLVAGPATLNTVVITDTRAGDPGYNAVAQAGDFVSASGARIDAADLGWAPRILTGRQEVSAGPAAAGLKEPQALVVAPAGGGLGTVEATADMTLHAPTATRPGAYRAVLTLTVI